MALLQISEPGASPDPHQRRIAVGIDLGTTHSLVAAVRNGVAECLPDAQGRVLLPSVVRYLESGGRQIGYEAQAAQAQDPENTIASRMVVTPAWKSTSSTGTATMAARANRFRSSW